jgi:hypothetical protein
MSFYLLAKSQSFILLILSSFFPYVAAHIHICTLFTCDYIHMSCSFKIYEHLTTLSVDTN